MAGTALRFDDLIALCRRCELVHKTNEETGQIALLHRVLDRDAPIYLIPYPGRGLATFALPLPFRVPGERITAVGEAVTRLNAAAHLAGWVLDADTGELAFRVTLPAHGAIYDDDGVRFVLRLIGSAVDAAAADLQQIALAGKTALELWPRASRIPVG